jgi:16S rRNA (guanine(966)-N(2))-methyltransferase RsmD
MATRPTTDRVREALFSVLGDITGMAAVDCYAGSGALGMEALSRGAASAWFIESGREASAVIEQNLRSLGLNERATISKCAVESTSRAIGRQRFDLVLSDPPWPICEAAAVSVVQLFANALQDGATVVLGHPKRVTLQLELPPGWSVHQVRSWGDSAMTLCRYEQGRDEQGRDESESRRDDDRE